MASVFSARQFNGGMNEWVSPSLLSSNYAALLVNADVSTGKMIPLKKPKTTSFATPVDAGHYGSRTKSAVKFYGRHYWSNNDATSSPYYGGNPENFLGIPYPSYSGTGANVAISADSPVSGETSISGSFKYCVTFVSANGWESAPGSLSEYEVPLTLSNQVGKITVSWSGNIVNYAKVYRTIDNGAEFYCIGEIHTSGGTLRDTKDDTTAQMLNVLDSIDNYPPPDKGKYLSQYAGVFFLAVGSTLYYSKQNNPHAWPPLQTLAFDDAITGIVPEFQGVLVFTRNNAYRIVGSESIETITKTYIPGNHGCVNNLSIAQLNNAPIWLSSDGLCIWDGSAISVISYQVMKVSGIGFSCATAAEDRYFLFDVNGGAVVYDQKNGGIFYRLKFDYEVKYAWYDTTTDYMYVQSSYAIFKYGDGDTSVMKYVSPDIGNESVMKRFRELYVVGNGEVTVSVKVDNKEVLMITIQGGRQRVKLPLTATGRAMNVTLETRNTIEEVTVLYD